MATCSNSLRGSKRLNSYRAFGTGRRDGDHPPGDSVGVFVEAAEERVVVGDVPEAIIDLFEADVFVIERLAQELLS